MEQITVVDIKKSYNRISYSFLATENLQKYFSGYDFVIEYPESIEDVPDGIAVIPFVCNVLPIVWLTNSALIIPELDESFYNCIPKVKNGYMIMFPETEFRGEIKADKLSRCDIPSKIGKCAMFYSGGVDSMETLFRHLDECPTLISIWGSDIKYDNEKGWAVVHKAIEEAANKYRLNDVVIRSTFRDFDMERELNLDFSRQLRDGWWHGVKHGIGLLGHVAPYAYLNGIEIMYIASSNCPEDGHVRCASNPLIDNHVRYADCSVVHDGFEFSRQDKIRNIVQFNSKQKESLPLHVCWKSQTGTNCCKCEKCYRTIAGLLVEGGNPEEYGFSGFDEYLDNMQAIVIKESTGILKRHWTKIQKGLIKNKKNLKASPYWKNIRWILKADFYHPETIKESIPLRTGLRPWLSQFLFYQRLHSLKERLK